MSEGTFGNPEIVEYETDILIIGGGMAACGAAVNQRTSAQGAARGMRASAQCGG